MPSRVMIRTARGYDQAVDGPVTDTNGLKSTSEMFQFPIMGNQIKDGGFFEFLFDDDIA